MSEQNIEQLRKAYEQSPDNTILSVLLVEALWASSREEEALAYITESGPTFLKNADHRLLAGRVAVAAEKPELALNYCSDKSPEELIVRAEAYLALSKNKEGLEAYNTAIEANAALENETLENALHVSSRSVARTSQDGTVVNFKVLSNEGLVKPDDEEGEVLIAKFLQPQESTVTFKDVGGHEDVKKQIHRKIILPFQKPSLFQKFRKKAGGGVLLFGPPGCGKTLLARATAGECDASFYNIAISDILDMYIGESERKLSAIFEQARRTAPSVMFFDELEALAGKRHFNTDSTTAKLVSQFLSEMDGFSSNNQGVLVLGATNVPWSIDPAFRRPGRFDRVQFIPPPDKNARRAILQILMMDRPAEEDIDFGQLASLTSGFSGADLGNLIETACDEAIERSIETGLEVPITGSFMREALKEVKSTTTEWLTTARNYARYANEGGQYDDVTNFLNKYGR